MEYNRLCPWETLFQWQKDYIAEPGWSFLLSGRQCGKTTAMSIKAVELCLNHFKKGDYVLISSITEKQAQHLLAKSLAYSLVKYPNQIKKGKLRPTFHKIHFKNGTGILCYAAGETGQGLRGFTIKKLMNDEGSRMSEEYFVAVMPSLSVVRGSMDIASTPFGKTHKDGSLKFFYKCSIDPQFKKFFISAEECPLHTKEFLDGQKRMFTKLKYAQEYLAIFTDELMQLFPDDIVREAMGKYLVHKGNTYCGVDVARLGEDDNVIISGRRSPNRKFLQMIEMDVKGKTRITKVAELIKDANIKHKFKKIYIDTGGVGGGVFDILLQDNKTKRKVISIDNATRSLNRDDTQRKRILKEDLYENLLKLLEDGNIGLLNDEEIFQSLKSVQYEVNETGRVHIYGTNTHIAEALIRLARCMQDKSLGLWCR